MTSKKCKSIKFWLFRASHFSLGMLLLFLPSTLSFLRFSLDPSSIPLHVLKPSQSPIRSYPRCIWHLIISPINFPSLFGSSLCVPPSPPQLKHIFVAYNFCLCLLNGYQFRITYQIKLKPYKIFNLRFLTQFSYDYPASS